MRCAIIEQKHLGGMSVGCKVTFVWDGEAGVWVATSDDVPGLALESKSFDALVEKVRAAVPELLRLNCDQ